MMKTPNCSTWNSLKSRLFKFAVCVSYSASLVFVPFASASASAVGYAPISGGNVGGLLSDLGYLERVDGGYKWVKCSPLENYVRDKYYTQDIFGDYVPKIKTDEVLTDGDLSPLLGVVIPENTYTTDGTNYYVGKKKVTASDMFINAKALIGVNYSMPTNVSGSQYTVGSYSEGDYHYGISFSSKQDIDKDVYYFPFVTTPSGGAFVFDEFFSPVSNGFKTYNSSLNKSGSYLTGSNGSGVKKYYYYPISNPVNSTGFYTSDKLNSLGSSFSFVYYPKFLSVTGSGSLSYSADNQFTLLFTRGLPVFTVEADKEKLSNSIVQVKNDNEDDDNNPVTPPTPQSPDFWQIWQTWEELVEEIDTGKDTNGNTDLGQYVNNNYIYNKVDVDINVPDTQNINMSGGLDINGSGDINITVHEDVSLPSAGDGSGFYNPDATDVIGALGKDNPVTSVISGLFSALDPALVGVFSVSVSLLFVLGLWKLIRG